MGSSNIDERKKSEIILSTVHYIITVIFFFLILINIVTLTIGTINMNVPSSDTNAVTAKNLMISACVITYVFLLLILIFLGVCYSYSSYDTPETRTYYQQLTKTTGGEDLYMSMRIVTFSILMFVSLIVSALCLEAANYIDKSEDPSKYSDQYNLCKDMGRMFMVHFIFFSTAQLISYSYQALYSADVIKSPPGKFIPDDKLL